MWTWLLNPKNLLLAALTALCVSLLILSLWYRGSYAHSVSEAKIAKAEVAEQKSQLEEYARDMTLMKAHQARMQEIETAGSSLGAGVAGLKVRELTDEEKTVARDISVWINSGVLPKAGSNEILPAAGKTDTAKPANNP